MRSVNRPDDPAYARFRFDAAREYGAGPRQIVLSGQTGDHRADMAGQVAGALDNAAEVLALAGYTLADVIRLGLFTTDVEEFLACWTIVRARFEPSAVPPNTLVQVVRFAHPAVQVEIEATAVYRAAIDLSGRLLRIGEELAARYAGLGHGGDLARAAAKRVAVILHPARTVSWDHRKLAAGA
jgi:enamine deaminase RidA (YjgF/YER057c/UK114 family)